MKSDVKKSPKGKHLKAILRSRGLMVNYDRGNGGIRVQVPWFHLKA